MANKPASRRTKIIAYTIVFGLIGLGIYGTRRGIIEQNDVWYITTVFGVLALLFLFWIISFKLKSPEEQARLRAAANPEQGKPVSDPGARTTLAMYACRDKAKWLGGAQNTAKIVTIADVGGGEHRRLIYLELEIELEGEVHRIATGEKVEGGHMGLMAPGRELFVRVDPQDPSQIAVDWERSLQV